MPGILRRAVRMQPEELRFRLSSEARKAADRVRTAILPPRWDRQHLAGVLASAGGRSPAWTAAVAAVRSGNARAAHLALAAHFSQRQSPLPVTPRGLPRIADAIKSDHPEAAQAAARRAGRLLRGRYDLLGYRDLDVGVEPDWHRDPVHDRRAPRMFWASVPYLDPALGDHKVVWELNRHQHWLAFARAHALSGERPFYTAFTAQLAGWLDSNPPLIGTNWASMLELAFRSLTWLWMLEFFAPAAGPDDRNPWIVDLLIGVDRQLTHVERNLSHYFSPNTHLTGEALALYVGGMVLPELQRGAARAALGRDVLIREATRQVQPDGGHAELSTHYHRYSTDFYLLAAAVARAAQDPAAAVFDDAAHRQARYLRTIADDSGVIPQIGDDDGGQLFPICGRHSSDCRDTLATAAVLLRDRSLATGPAPEETYWMCGLEARRLTGLRPARWGSSALAASGYYVSRTENGDHLVFDAGPHGFLNGGHAHADALACVLSVRGRPLLIDPGTATYTMDQTVRDRFRTTAMHNTIVVDGRRQSEPRGAFHWTSAAAAQATAWRTTGGCDYIEGTHDAYAPVRHTRAILAVHGVGWLFLDHLSGPGTAGVDVYWHVHPSWTCAPVTSQAANLRSGELTVALAGTLPLEILEPGADTLAFHAPAYGAVVPSPVLRASGRIRLPRTIATFVAAAGPGADVIGVGEIALESRPSTGWQAAACLVRWREGSMIVLSAVDEHSGGHPDGPARPGRWGAAALETDARLAAVIEQAGRPREVVIVDGAFLGEGSGHPLLALPGCAPVLRASLPALAPTVHGVGPVHSGIE